MAQLPGEQAKSCGLWVQIVKSNDANFYCPGRRPSVQHRCVTPLYCKPMWIFNYVIGTTELLHPYINFSLI